jgi:alpha-1,2-mannosyltransferase
MERPYYECMLVLKRGPVAWLLFAVLPMLLTLEFTIGVHHAPAFDFRALWDAGRNVAAGQNPYPSVASIPSSPTVAHQEFIYPAAVAVAMVPLGLLPFGVAAGVFIVLLIASVGMTLWLLGVRDWRCYGVAFASIPVLESFRLGAITPLLALGLAGIWVTRDRRWSLPILVCGMVLAKLFLWPLYVWLIATGRRGAAVRSAVLTGIAGLVGWSVVGFGTLGRYPHVLQRMTDVQYRKSYGFDGLLASLGVGSTWSRLGVVVAGVVGVAAIAAAVRWGRRGEVAFGVAIFVSLLASPLVWLHYYTLLLVPVALFSARLSLLWLVPLLLWATPYPESGGSAWRIALPIALTAAAVGFGQLRAEQRASEALIPWRPSRGVAQPG